MPITKEDWKDCVTDPPPVDKITGASCKVFVFTSHKNIKSAYYNFFRNEWCIDGGNSVEYPVEWVSVTYGG